MNLPNIITISRLLLTPPAVISILKERVLHSTTIILLAMATDILDGFLARKLKKTSSTGAFLDALADKIFIQLVLLSLLSVQKIPFWFFSIIFLKDLLIVSTWFFSQFFAIYIPIIPRMLGKTAFLLQLLSAICSVTEFIYTKLVLLITATLTIAAGVDYIKSNIKRYGRAI